MDIPVVWTARGRRYASSGRGREIRRTASLSIADIAAALGTSAPAVSRWERGLQTPGREEAAAYGRLMYDLERETSDDPC